MVKTNKTHRPSFQPEKRANKMKPSLKLILCTALILIMGIQIADAQQVKRADSRQSLMNDQPIPPPAPNVKASIGDGMVTLYWDDVAEQHYDPYFDGYVLYKQRISPPQAPAAFDTTFANPRNFQGYKIYKSTDPGFLDALRITDNQGNPDRLAFEVMFDLRNEIRGYHPASVGGQRIWLGNDTGLRRVFTDTGLINGRTYYYAVVAFTHGDAIPDFELPIIDEFGQLTNPLPNQIFTHPPLESPLDIEILPNGTVITGVNVVKVVPQKGAPGFVEPETPELIRITGTGRGTIELDIVDPFVLKEGNTYSITFEDTLVTRTGNILDLVTKNFTFRNLTSGEVLFANSREFTGSPLPVVDGVQLTITSLAERVIPDTVNTRWVTNQSSNIHQLTFALASRYPASSDYRIEFFDESVRQSRPYTINNINLPAENVNFIVYNITTGEEVEVAYFTNPQLPRDLRTAHFLDEDTIIITGAAGLIQKSTDGGQTYQIMESNVNVRLNGLSFIDSNRGWAAGRAGTIIRTTNAGETWSQQDSGVTQRLTNIFFVDDEFGWAVGDGGVILRTVNGGQTWQSSPSGTVRNLSGVYFTDRNNGWATGFLTTLRTTDGGQTWQNVNTGVVANFIDVFFQDDDNGWMVGSAGTLLRTTDGGNSWINLSNSQYRTLNEIKFTDANNGWAVGQQGSVIHTNDGGDTWTIQSSGTQGELFGIGIFDQNKAVIVGTNAIRLSTENAGGTWQLAETFRRFRAAFDDNNTSRSDVIYLLEQVPGVTDPNDDTDKRDTWRISMTARTANSPLGLTVDPIGGDELQLFTIKPFTSADEFQFTIQGSNIPSIDRDVIKDRLSEIRVVPNPYLVTHLAEPAGDRQLHFVNIPSECTIRIFTVSGRLIQTINVNNPVNSDRYIWDLRTSSNDEISYGVYIYHVSAPGIGEKVGKFAVIK
jgi:photosystem II stability/assembly factor-like uncharacterized protein